MAIENAFYKEGVPYASGLTVGVSAPIDLRCVINIPAQLAVIGAGNVYKGMPFFISNYDLGGNPGYFVLLRCPYKTENVVENEQIIAVNCWKTSASEPVQITEYSTIDDLWRAGFETKRIDNNEGGTANHYWLDLDID